MNSHLPVSLSHVGADPKGPAKLDLRQIQDFVWRRWKLVVATSLVAAGIAALLLLSVAPRYTASAQVLLEPRKSRVFGAESLVPDAMLDSASVDSQISVIQSFNLIRHVVERENLAADPEMNPPPAAQGLWSYLTGLVSIGGGEDAKTGEQPDAALAQTERLVLQLKGRLDVQRVGRTNVLAVSVTSEDATKAARLANAVANAFVVDQLEARYEAAKTASSWLAERMDGLREQVRGSEEAVARFRIDHGLESASTSGRVTLSEQQLSELSAKLASARAETAEKRAKFEQAQRTQAGGGELEAIPDVVRSNVISQLRTQQAEVARKEADLSARYSATYPLVVNARAERRDLDRSIRNEVDRIISNLRNDYDVARAREASLQSSLARVSGESGLDSDTGIKLRELVRTNDANKTLFENFLSKAKITQEQSTFEEREARVISQATRPTAASYPRKTLLIALALAAGAMLGVGGGVSLDLLNAGFDTPRTIEDATRLPVLASIPLVLERVRTIENEVLDPAEYLVQRPLSHYSESIRALRVGVQMADVDNPPRIVLITSSTPAEGKSTVAASLGFSAAAAGQRVLLMDCDLRRPQLSRLFGLETKLGLVDVLTGTTELQEVLAVRGGVTVLPAGSKTQNPPDLLGSAKMQSLVRAVRSSFDYVVIDSAPIAPVIDARVLAHVVDKIIYVVRWRNTAREVVLQNLEALRSDRKVAGIAFNLVDESKTPRYGSNAYYSGGYESRYFES